MGMRARVPSNTIQPASAPVSGRALSRLWSPAERAHRHDGAEHAPGCQHGERRRVDSARCAVGIKALQQPVREVIDGNSLATVSTASGIWSAGKKMPEIICSGSVSMFATAGAALAERTRPDRAKPMQQNAALPTASVSSNPGARSLGIVTPYGIQPISVSTTAMSAVSRTATTAREAMNAPAGNSVARRPVRLCPAPDADWGSSRRTARPSRAR